MRTTTVNEDVFEVLSLLSNELGYKPLNREDFIPELKNAKILVELNNHVYPYPHAITIKTVGGEECLVIKTVHHDRDILERDILEFRRIFEAPFTISSTSAIMKMLSSLGIITHHELTRFNIDGKIIDIDYKEIRKLVRLRGITPEEHARGC